MIQKHIYGNILIVITCSMKKIWIVSSVFIVTGVFIYTMSLISSRNTCTWVRVYECLALEKQKWTVTSQAIQQNTIPVRTVQTYIPPVKTTVLPKKITAPSPAVAPVQQPVQQPVVQTPPPVQQAVTTPVHTRTRAS